MRPPPEAVATGGSPSASTKSGDDGHPHAGVIAATDSRGGINRAISRETVSAGRVSERGTIEHPATNAPLPLRTQQRAEERHTRFFERLPGRLGRDGVYLKADAHYIEVVTTVGSGLILMRFSDAIADLDNLGMQVHRSYWVAHRHMNRLIRREQRTLLGLSGGYQVPVSRTYRSAVWRMCTDRTAADAK